MLDTLLETKFHIPPPLTNIVSRGRLVSRLDAGLRQGSRLTLISAPAGYGKTTLLGEWIRRSNLTAAWLSLDVGDNDPARFLAYVISALQRVKPGVGEKSLNNLQSSQSQTPISLLSPLVNEMSQISTDFLIVFDDYHNIHNQVVHDTVSFFLEHLPPQAHIAITTRADPLLPVARLRGRGQITELRQNDLRFTEEEAAQFLEMVSGLEFSAEDVSALTARTEGWAAGLQMAAKSISEQKQVSTFVQDFTGSNRYILDYLLEEVLQSQPESIQSFLLHTSILDQLCGPLCDAVIGHTIDSFASSQTILESLEHKNLFIIPLDDRREWYRYHRLFADLLKQRLTLLHPDIEQELQKRASDWYEGNELIEAAIEHALAAGDSERAASLIEHCAETTLMQSQVTTLSGWLEQLPEEEIHRRPTLGVYHAWALLWKGAPLEAIEARLEIAASREDHPAEVLPLQAFLAIYNGDISNAEKLAGQALEKLPEEDNLLRSIAYFILASVYITKGDTSKGFQTLEETARVSRRAGNVMMAVLVFCELGDQRYKQGRLHQAKTLYQQALELGTNEQGEQLPVAGKALIGLGDITREWNDFENAERFLTDGIALAEQWSVLGTFEGYLNLIMLKDSQGDTRTADEMFSYARELAFQFDASEMDDLVIDMFAARRDIALGDLQSARQWAEHRDQGIRSSKLDSGKFDDILIARMQKYENIIFARLLIAEEQYAQALTLLEQVLPEVIQAERLMLIVEVESLQAIALQALGKKPEAITVLSNALKLAEPEGFVRIFVDQGQAVKELLEMTRKEEEEKTIVAYIDRLLEAYTHKPGMEVTAPSRQKRHIIEPLSDREMEVLRLLPTGLSSTEMAEELTISVNTLRTHLKNIYAKLGVHSRYEAIERARETGLS